jgi:HSP20 family protein
MSSTLFYYKPFADLDRLFMEAPGARHCHAGRQTNAGSKVVQTLKPRMDLHEDAKTNTVTATFELPGLNKDNVQIDVQNDRLSISGETKISSQQEESGYVVQERKFGKFARTLQLARGTTEDQIKASLKDGVLTVTFPKTTPEEAPKKISISQTDDYIVLNNSATDVE